MPAALATPRRRRGARAAAHARRAAALLGALCAAAALGACGTSHPGPISAAELAEARTFPFYRIYWAGPAFLGQPLAAADGQRSYLSNVGDSVYYGDCVRSKGIFGGGSCLLPLQITTVVYKRHLNSTLGPQRNTVIRGVPAVVYDEGRSIELYSGRLAIDIFSDSFDHALAGAMALQPLNAPGSATGSLPPPVYCPPLTGPMDAQVSELMDNLPGHICQRSAAQTAFSTALTE